MAPTPAPAPFPQGMGFPSPAPAPLARAPYPASPAPAPMAVASPSDEEEEEESSSEESSSQQQSEENTSNTPMPAPMPAPMQVATEPQPEPISYNDVDIDEDDNQQPIAMQQQQKLTVTNGNKQPTPTSTTGNHNLSAAAELINTLDTAYAEANAATAATALDAEQARTTARTAAEIVRRYATRSHPRNSNGSGEPTNNYFDSESPAAAQARIAAANTGHKTITAGRAPMMGMTVQTNTNTSFFGAASSPPLENDISTPTSTTLTTTTRATATPHSNNNGGRNIHMDPKHFPKTPPSSANRFATAHAEDTLTLSLELERTKQNLEGERMAHDETKNMLAEERSKKAQLLSKLQRLENNMETQRETLGRSEDALEEELKQTRYRMEAAEEDAQAALDFAKESEEGREKLEEMLEQAMAEIQSLRDQVANIAYYTAESHNIQNDIGTSTQDDDQQFAYSTDGGQINDMEYQQQYQQQQPAQPPQTFEDAKEREIQFQLSEESDYQEPAESLPPSDPDVAEPDDHMEEQEAADGTPRRTVHFSDPISFSKSPSDDSAEFEPAQMEAEQKLLVAEIEEKYDEISQEVEASTSLQSLSTPMRPARPLVSAGRKLLHQSTGKDSSFDATMYYSFEFTPEKSAERRQRLRDQLRQLDTSVSIPTPTKLDSTPQRKQLQFTTNYFELCKTAVEIIQASGQRLDLDGHWWRETTADGEEPTPVDSLARQFCQSVEVKISRQKNEISELESLCSFLEESVGSNTRAPDSHGADSADGNWSSNWA